MASRWKPGWDDLGLVLLTVTGLGLVCVNEFIHLDDPPYVFANPMVQHGLSLRGLTWAFTNSDLGMWLPLTWLSLQLDATLFGPVPISNWNDVAWGFHLTNLLLHMANVILLYRLLLGVTAAQGRSFLVAALFAVHPLRVESVAWVTERKDVLCGLFFLLTLFAYDRYVLRPSWGNYGLVLVCFLAGLGSKPIMVTMPFVLLLWDYWPLGRFSWERSLLEKLPLLLLALAVSFLTFQKHRQMGAFGSTPLSERLSLACVSYGFHLWKTIWPTDLAVIYPRHRWPWTDWHVLAGLALLLSISALVLRQGRSKPYVSVGWCWFVGVLLPVSGISQVGTACMNDRFTYLPHIGLFIMIVWLLGDLFDRAGVDRATRVILSCGVLGFSLYLTIQQTRLWHDTPTLMLHSMRVTQRNETVYRTLAGYYLDTDNLKLAEDLCIEALHNTKDRSFDILLGSIYARQGKVTLALSHLQEADDVDLQDPLQSLFLMAGYKQLDHHEDVIRHADRLLRVDPANLHALLFKAEALSHLPDRREELLELLPALRRMEPTNPRVQELWKKAAEN